MIHIGKLDVWNSLSLQNTVIPAKKSITGSSVTTSSQIREMPWGVRSVSPDTGFFATTTALLALKNDVARKG